MQHGSRKGAHKHSWRRIAQIHRLRPLAPGLFRAARRLASTPGYAGTLFCRCGAARVPTFSPEAATLINTCQSGPVITSAGLLSGV